MLRHPTIDLLRELKLDGMADAFVELQAQDRSADLGHAEWLALLLDREAAKRNTNRVQTRLRAARLRHGQASVEDVDYRAVRKLDKALFQQLATGRWIAEHRNLLITGPCGIGKSWLACALAQKACRDGYSVHYARVPRLFADLELAHGDAGRGHRRAHASRAGLPLVDRHHRARQAPWPGPARGRLSPRARDRRALLHERRLHPEEQPGSRQARIRHGRAGDNARQYPWLHLLPLRRRPACSPIRPSTSCAS